MGERDPRAAKLAVGVLAATGALIGVIAIRRVN
jgi:hypothetical protein